jgi:hypothetical protein
MLLSGVFEKWLKPARSTLHYAKQAAAHGSHRAAAMPSMRLHLDLLGRARERRQATALCVAVCRCRVSAFPDALEQPAGQSRPLPFVLTGTLSSPPTSVSSSGEK